MGFWEWIDRKEFMNTYQERHAFVEGFGESFCFWKPRHGLDEELQADLEHEHHYYMVGRVLGFVCLALFGVWIVKLLRRK